MLSRVAESIYWLARYMERAESVARLVDVNMHMALDLPPGILQQWEPVILTTGDRELFEARYDGYSRQNVIQFLTFDRDNPNSVISCVTAARENARSIRECISSEMWEHINTVYLEVMAAARDDGSLALPHDFFRSIKLASHLFVGLTVVTLSHGEEWHFCRLGRLIERADKTTRILDMKYHYILPDPEDVGSPLDSMHWAAILRSASAYEAYRKCHGLLDATNAVAFLLSHAQFPRSVHYCLIRADDSLHTITGSPVNSYCNAAERYCGALRAEIAFKPVDSIIATGLHEYLDGIQLQLNKIGQAVFDTFFALRPVTGAMAS